MAACDDCAKKESPPNPCFFLSKSCPVARNDKIVSDQNRTLSEQQICPQSRHKTSVSAYSLRRVSELMLTKFTSKTKMFDLRKKQTAVFPPIASWNWLAEVWLRDYIGGEFGDFAAYDRKLYPF